MNEMAAIVEPTVAHGRLSPMPPEIAKAVVTVMGQIKRLAKEGTNSFQRYQYTSVDQFFEAVGPLMAEACIFTLLLESTMDVEKRETTNDRGETKSAVWLLATYDIYLFHASGSSCGPIQRSIQVPASGAQSYASAMSFVEKYFLRSLFKIPTGDADADSEDKHSLPARSNRSAPPKTSHFVNDEQMHMLGKLLTSLGKGAWEEFSQSWGIARLGELPSDKFSGALAQLQVRHAALKQSSAPSDEPATTQRRPPAPPSAKPMPISLAFDFAAHKARCVAALDFAKDFDACDGVFAHFAQNRKDDMTDAQYMEIRDLVTTRQEALDPARPQTNVEWT
jgi:ERF superfamily